MTEKVQKLRLIDRGVLFIVREKRILLEFLLLPGWSCSKC